MDLSIALEQIRALSVEERIWLVQAIWNTIAADEVPSGLTESQKQVLDRRIADLEADPDNVLTWEQIKASVRRKE